MSAWRIGSDVSRRSGSRTLLLRIPAERITGAHEGADIEVVAEVQESETQSTADLVRKAADVYTKWIPGDVLAVFVALTAAFRGTVADATVDTITPHAWGILVTGIALAAGITLLGAVAANLAEKDAAKRAGPMEIFARMVLAVLAFGFWSLTVPGAWWEVKGWDAGVLAAVSFAISIAFALVAEIIVAVIKDGSG